MSINFFKKTNMTKSRIFRLHQFKIKGHSNYKKNNVFKIEHASLTSEPPGSCPGEDGGGADNSEVVTCAAHRLWNHETAGSWQRDPVQRTPEILVQLALKNQK